MEKEKLKKQTYTRTQKWLRFGIAIEIIAIIAGLGGTAIFLVHRGKVLAVSTKAPEVGASQYGNSALFNNMRGVGAGAEGFYALTRTDYNLDPSSTGGTQVSHSLQHHYDDKLTFRGLGVVSGGLIKLPLTQGSSGQNIFDFLAAHKNDNFTLSFKMWRSPEPRDASNSPLCTTEDHQLNQHCYHTDGGWDATNGQGAFAIDFAVYKGAGKSLHVYGDGQLGGLQPSSPTTKDLKTFTFALDPNLLDPNDGGQIDRNSGFTININDNGSLGWNWFVGDLNISEISLVASGDPGTNVVAAFSPKGAANSTFVCGGQPIDQCTDWRVTETLQPAEDYLVADTTPDANGPHLHLYSQNFKDLSLPANTTLAAKVRYNNFRSNGSSDEVLPPNVTLPGRLDLSLQKHTVIFDDKITLAYQGVSIFMMAKVRDDSPCGQTFNHQGTTISFVDANNNLQYDPGTDPQFTKSDGQTGYTLNDSTEGASCPSAIFTAIVPAESSTCGSFYNSYYTAQPNVMLQFGQAQDFTQYNYSLSPDPTSFTLPWQALPGTVEQNKCLPFDLYWALRNLGEVGPPPDILHRGEIALYFRMYNPGNGTYSAIFSDSIVYTYPWVQTWQGDVHSNAVDATGQQQSVGFNGQKDNVFGDSNPPSGHYNASFYISSPGGDAPTSSTSADQLHFTSAAGDAFYSVQNIGGAAPDLGFPTRSTVSDYFLGQVDFAQLKKDATIRVNGDCHLQGDVAQSLVRLDCTGDNVQVGGNRVIYINGNLTIDGPAALLFKNGTPTAVGSDHFGNSTFVVDGDGINSGMITVDQDILYDSKAGLSDTGSLASVAFLARGPIKIKKNTNFLVGIYYSEKSINTYAQ